MVINRNGSWIIITILDLGGAIVSLIDDLIYNSKFAEGNFDSRDQHLESIISLSKEGYSKMEVRASEISRSDVEYFKNEGFIVTLHNNGEYRYFRINWNEKAILGVKIIKFIGNLLLIFFKFTLYVTFIIPFKIIKWIFYYKIFTIIINKIKK